MRPDNFGQFITMSTSTSWLQLDKGTVVAKSEEEKKMEQEAALKSLQEMRKRQVIAWLGATVMSLIEKHPKSPFIRGGILQKMNIMVPDNIETPAIVDWLVENRKW